MFSIDDLNPAQSIVVPFIEEKHFSIIWNSSSWDFTLVLQFFISWERDTQERTVRTSSFEILPSLSKSQKLKMNWEFVSKSPQNKVVIPMMNSAVSRQPFLLRSMTLKRRSLMMPGRLQQDAKVIFDMPVLLLSEFLWERSYYVKEGIYDPYVFQV